MSVSDVLTEQMKQALKGGRKERLRALRLLKAELQVAQTSGKEFEETDVVKSYANKLRKSLDEYGRLGLPDQAARLKQELQVVQEFLPEQMSRSELENLIAALIKENNYGPRDIGQLMKAIMSQHRDVVDGRVAQEIARPMLAELG